MRAEKRKRPHGLSTCRYIQLGARKKLERARRGALDKCPYYVISSTLHVSAYAFESFAGHYLFSFSRYHRRYTARATGMFAVRS